MKLNCFLPYKFAEDVQSDIQSSIMSEKEEIQIFS